MTLRISAYFQLVRPLNLAITFCSVVAAAVIAGGTGTSAVPIFLAGISAAFIAGGANAINDYFDVDIDRVNRPERPIPSNALTRENARRCWMVVTTLGLIVSLFISGTPPFAIALSSAVLLYVYSSSLKATPLVGNIVIGVMTGLAFIYGAAAVGAPARGLMPAAFAFLVTLAREVVKDIEDRAGDALQQAKTFPIRFGVRSAQWVASGTLTALIAVTFAAFAAGLYDKIYLVIVVVADCMFAFAAVEVLRSDSPSAMRRISSVLKASMVVGLAAIYFGGRP